MASVKGVVLHCGKYGCIVRLEDGRLANLPADEAAHAGIRRLLTTTRRPALPFIVTPGDGWPVLRVASPEATSISPDVAFRAKLGDDTAGDDAQIAGQDSPAAPTVSASTPLDEKIIEYLRQTADWDPTGTAASRVQEAKQKRADRLGPFEERAHPEYRDSRRKHRKRR